MTLRTAFKRDSGNAMGFQTLKVVQYSAWHRVMCCVSV